MERLSNRAGVRKSLQIVENNFSSGGGAKKLAQMNQRDHDLQAEKQRMLLRANEIQS